MIADGLLATDMSCATFKMTLMLKLSFKAVQCKMSEEGCEGQMYTNTRRPSDMQKNVIWVIYALHCENLYDLEYSKAIDPVYGEVHGLGCDCVGQHTVLAGQVDTLHTSIL